jgi:K+ transporter
MEVLPVSPHWHPQYKQTIVHGEADAVIEVRELDKAVLRRQKRLAALFSVVLFVFIALDLLELFSSVRLTVHYGPAWFVAYGAMILALLFYFWSIRDKLRERFNRRNRERRNNYMCPNDQAFKELDVGSTVRLQGEISPFGITIEQYFWKSK